jgi:hypothetical protein
MLHLLDIGDAEAADLIAAIAAELPPGASMGRLRAASRAGVLADYGDSAALYGLDDGAAWRLVELDDVEREVTTWAAGQEVSRSIVRVH